MRSRERLARFQKKLSVASYKATCLEERLEEFTLKQKQVKEAEFTDKQARELVTEYHTLYNQISLEICDRILETWDHARALLLESDPCHQVVLSELANLSISAMVDKKTNTFDILNDFHASNPYKDEFDRPYPSPHRLGKLVAKINAILDGGRC